MADNDTKSAAEQLHGDIDHSSVTRRRKQLKQLEKNGRTEDESRHEQ
jgi:hypothetical protein